MRRILALIGIIWLAAGQVVFAQGTGAQGTGAQENGVQDNPVLVELYTSQGCSSCPPADKLLGQLAARDDVIALALHVDYWDYIGWKDSFANSAHAKRQRAYAAKGGRRSVYTPQMIVDGTDHVVGNRPMDVADIIQRHRAQENFVDLQITRQGNQVSIDAQATGRVGKTSIYLVRYSPFETVAIKRGENAGRTLMYYNVVTSWDRIDGWNGSDRYSGSVTVSGDAPVVVIVQDGYHGSVLASARLR